MRGYGRTDIERLASYIAAKLRDVTKQETITVTRVRTNGLVADAPKLMVHFNSLPCQECPSTFLRRNLNKIFDKEGHGSSARVHSSDKRLEPDAEGEYHLALFIDNPLAALRAAQENDAALYATSQEYRTI